MQLIQACKSIQALEQQLRSSMVKRSVIRVMIMLMELGDMSTISISSHNLDFMQVKDTKVVQPNGM